MGFRRTTEDNPEENCDSYNKAYLRAMAHKENLPVIRIDALHEGIDQAEGMKIDERGSMASRQNWSCVSSHV